MKEEIRFRKTIYKPGDKVRAVWFSLFGGAMNDNEIVPPGTLGVVDSVDDMGTVHVNWENGASLGALVEDSIEVVN
jgi:hypothetical protein